MNFCWRNLWPRSRYLPKLNNDYVNESSFVNHIISYTFQSYRHIYFYMEKIYSPYSCSTGSCGNINTSLNSELYSSLATTFHTLLVNYQFNAIMWISMSILASKKKIKFQLILSKCGTKNDLLQIILSTITCYRKLLISWVYYM